MRLVDEIRALPGLLGVLRFMLLLSVVILILSASLAGGSAVKQGWQLIPSLIFPALVPMYFFILPLDMTMCKIQMSEPGTDERKYKYIIQLEGVLLLLLLLAWLPFIIRLF